MRAYEKRFEPVICTTAQYREMVEDSGYPVFTCQPTLRRTDLLRLACRIMAR